MSPACSKRYPSPRIEPTVGCINPFLRHKYMLHGATCSLWACLRGTLKPAQAKLKTNTATEVHTHLSIHVCITYLLQRHLLHKESGGPPARNPKFVAFISFPHKTHSGCTLGSPSPSKVPIIPLKFPYHPLNKSKAQGYNPTQRVHIQILGFWLQQPYQDPIGLAFGTRILKHESQ